MRVYGSSKSMKPEEYSAALTSHKANAPGGVLVGLLSRKRKLLAAKLDFAGDMFEYGFER